MDRQVCIQVVTMLVVLGILVRWIPNDDPRDVLGRGDPLRSIEADRVLKGFDADGYLRQAYLRGIRRPSPEKWFARWKKLLSRVDRIQEEGTTTQVQFKGMGRNDQWPMMYDLYPIPTTFLYYEDGSRADDATVPGATVITGGLLRPEDMDDEQLDSYRQSKNRQGKLQSKRGDGEGK